jgi:hypothetical protein
MDEDTDKQLKDEDKRLKKSLEILRETVNNLKSRDEVREFQPIGNVFKDLKPVDDDEPASFIRALRDLSDAVILVRSTSKTPAISSLPVPPYDLWLPFKTPASSTVKASSEAIKLFNDERHAISSKWEQILAIWHPEATPRGSDPDLQSLQERLLNLFEFCNRSCTALTHAPLFEPSGTASNNLFVRLIPTSVTSEADFDRVVIGLYQVFDEKLRQDVRRPSDDKPIPDQLVKVSNLCKPYLKDLSTLRNRSAAHDHKEKSWETAPIFERLIGVGTIELDKSADWLELQKAVLKMMLSMLIEIRDVFESGTARD